ncbi:hypothetical protein PISMIDRAFT_13707 [Pisolithus microcarpus 441]|uniref:Uncharacterized protein n=1 Tax=Pisolithus microcarpus 441 TaxID=765257 RepID=A0A0C9YZH0_9AGAM|nr:hypothetical protein BKA83DRAFT_13707 [Pisolithus microcarpus]KIK19369.1 hypothetical protein PISMIDRAFT_13707 [Pisolithus microcarpus 441]
MADGMMRKGPLTAMSSKKSLPKVPHLLIPACHACRTSRRTYVITANTGSRIRSCDRCRSGRKRCVSDETEEGLSSTGARKRGRRTEDGDLSELKGQKSRTRRSPNGTRWGSKKATEKALKDEEERGVADVIRPMHLETTLQELTTNTTALTEAITRNMTAISEERRERAECDRKTSETMNLMLKVMYKIVDTGPIPSSSRRA